MRVVVGLVLVGFIVGFVNDDTSYELRHSVRHPVLPWGTTSHLALIVLNQSWRFVISLYIQTPKSALCQDIILIIIARTLLYKTNLMVIFVLDHP